MHTQGYHHKLNGEDIKHVFKEKDLGVLIDCGLTFEKHIQLNLLTDFREKEYSERLKLIKLLTLRYRRICGDMSEFFKHFHAYDKSIFSSYSF